MDPNCSNSKNPWQACRSNDKCILQGLITSFSKGSTKVTWERTQTWKSWNVRWRVHQSHMHKPLKDRNWHFKFCQCRLLNFILSQWCTSEVWCNPTQQLWHKFYVYEDNNVRFWMTLSEKDWFRSMFII